MNEDYEAAHHQRLEVVRYTEGPRRKEPERHRWLDSWMVARGDALKALVDATVSFIQHHEQHCKTRVRARKTDNHQHHLKRIEVVVSNLAYAVLMPPETGRLAVKLGHGNEGRSRYDSPVLGKTFSPLIFTLAETGFLHLRRSFVRGEVSSIAPDPWFAKKVAEFGVQLSDFGRDEYEEIILLTRNTREVAHWSQPKRSRKAHRERIEYDDTAETTRYRAELRAINEWLSKADIDFVDDGQEPRVDPFDRTLRRRFVILKEQEHRFDQGGRFYGGFWMNLKSSRRGSIRLNGEPIADLDYGSMFTRLAYAEVGATPPGGDLYAIPGLEEYRSGVKLAMNCFLFDGGRRSRWPDEMGIGVGSDQDAKGDPEGHAASFDARLPEGWTVGRTKKAILAVHPALKDAWGRQLGYGLMFKESEILVGVVQKLMRDGVPVLPIHDGLMVPRSASSLAIETMKEGSRQRTGATIPVSVKESSSPLED